MNFGSRSEKVSRRVAQLEADLIRLQTESDTLTGRVADTGRAPYRFNPEYSSQILFRVFRYTSPELGNRAQENGRIQTDKAKPTLQTPVD